MPSVEYSDETRSAFLKMQAIFGIAVLFIISALVVAISVPKRPAIGTAGMVINVLFGTGFVVLFTSVPWIRKFNTSVRRDKANAKVLG